MLTRTRSGYGGGTLFDVQLQAVASGDLAWARTFSDGQEAARFRASLESDLAELDVGEFSRKHGIPIATA